MINTKIVTFLENRDWTIKEITDKFFHLYPPVEFDIDPNFSISVPVSLDKVDTKSFTKNILEIISDFYSLTIDDLLLILKNDKTVLKVRVYDEETFNGQISLGRFEELIDKLKAILTDTASFVIDDSITSKRTPNESHKYLNLCNFLQTEKGSFVAKIELPSKEIIKDKDLFKPEISSEEINDRLSNVLQFVNDDIFNTEIANDVSEEYLLENGEKLNIKLLKDIETFYDKAELKNVDFTFFNIQQTKKVETQNITKEKLFKLTTFVEHLTNYAFEEKKIEVTVTITTLKSRDPEGLKNNVIFTGLLNQLPIVGTANLNSENYKDAIEAHKYKKYIKIFGLARKTRSRVRFISVESFTVLN